MPATSPNTASSPSTTTRRRRVGGAQPVSDRCVYAGVAENSVYVDPDHRGHGVGAHAARRPGHRSRAAGHLDDPDRHLPREHRQRRRCTKRSDSDRSGRRERIGHLNGVWRDTLFLERRSSLM